ncbi:hypothetical protein GLW04_06430 [Halobacillus litoralis]|uniref:Uncharacterized protein n=1 Tax=Halobacillus litoralis TaxID=45668 RepID=A0A845DT39_9BACI|nr:hypothetical protein [Halobacillus litoralis]MYL19522.1 hypothetical protein [Halobacillus litoralis]MYL37901.1 hypothetical protein [Halobacillus litoralis]
MTTDFCLSMAIGLSVISLGVGLYSGLRRWKAENYDYRMTAAGQGPAAS